MCVFLPEDFSFSQVKEPEEDLRVLPDAVGGEALQVEQQVMGHRNTAGVRLPLAAGVTLETRRKPGWVKMRLGWENVVCQAAHT